MSTRENLRRTIFKIAASRAGRSLLLLFVGLIDLPISRITGGVHIPSANWEVMPIIYLTTIGARSGKPRSHPVLSIPDGEKLILVGSNWGKAHNPAWVYNLRAQPEACVRKGNRERYWHARELHGQERVAGWQKAVAFYPPYIQYAQRSGRALPVFLLEQSQ